MPKFVLAYHGTPDINGPEDGAAHMEAWRAWSAGLGAAVVDPGMPVGKSMTVTPGEVVDNGGSNPISGVTVLQADGFDQVIEMVKACPHLSGSGSIEVAQAIEMDA